jgi:hypothetical protein
LCRLQFVSTQHWMVDVDTLMDANDVARRLLAATLKAASPPTGTFTTPFPEEVATLMPMGRALALTGTLVEPITVPLDVLKVRSI